MKAPISNSSNFKGTSNGAAQAIAHASQASAPNVPQATQAKGMYQLQKLRGRHHLILELSARGMRNVDIAKRLNITEAAVCYTINSELGQQKLRVLQNKATADTIDLIKEFATLAPVAVEVIEEVLTDPSAKNADRLSAADKILNGAGFAKKQSVEINVHHVTDEEIQAAKLEARRKGRLAGLLVEEAEVISIEDTNGRKSPD